MRHQRFAILNVTLLLMIALSPLLERESLLTGALFSGMFFLILISAVYAVGRRWHARGVVLPLAVLTSLAQILHLLRESTVIAAAANLCGIVVLLSVILLITRLLFSIKTADYETINAALCVYLLMGVLWSFVYSLVVLLAPESFAYPLAQEALERGLIDRARNISTLYYSFVTLTTLGYGDIVPMGAAAKVLAILEAMLGQVYLVVIVARLVGLQISGASEERV